jgi:hypothetical protein
MIKCSKCKGAMEAGYRADRGHLNLELKERWFKKEAKLLSLKKPLPVTTYRCKKCGYLESYSK